MRSMRMPCEPLTRTTSFSVRDLLQMGDGFVRVLEFGDLAGFHACPPGRSCDHVPECADRDQRVRHLGARTPTIS